MLEIVIPPLAIPRCAEDKPELFCLEQRQNNSRQQSSELLPASKQVPRVRGGPLQGPITRESLAAYVKVKPKTKFLPREARTRATAAQSQAAQGDADRGWRDRALRPLSRDVQQDFINIEHPSAFIDGAYAHVVATLRKPEYPLNLVDLAQRIVSDGMQHESRFNTIKAALAAFDEDQYLRSDFEPGQSRDVSIALGQRDSIIQALNDAYIAAGNEDFADCAKHIPDARETMNKLPSEGERLAESNIGIPFFNGL
jgi:hypothetical protein